MAEKFDIYEEYKKIFGVTTHKSLFSPDDEEYISLRQEIVDAKREFNHKESLPFEGVKLLSYEEFKRNEAVFEAEKNGNRIFYIHKYENSKLICYAAGYYNARDSRFVVLKESFFIRNEYVRHLISNERFLVLKMYFSIENNVIKEKRPHSYPSASLAASYILGEKASFEEWRDKYGKSLDFYYTRYKEANITEIEDKTFPDYVSPSSANVTDSVESPTPSAQNTMPSKSNYEGKHLFYIRSIDHCFAKGYYDTETTYFYICKDSLIAGNEHAEYVNTASSKSRKRFLEKACIQDGRYYRVIKDTKCRTASAAACYALGRTATYSMWTDDNGKFLKDLYPKLFFVGGNKFEEPKLYEEKDLSEHLFFLTHNSGTSELYKASGYFDVANEKFILKAGSIFAPEALHQYENSKFPEMRHKFISNHCDFFYGKIVLRRDTILNSPTMAASYVTGRIVKKRTIWIDSDGNTFNDVYGHK